MPLPSLIDWKHVEWNYGTGWKGKDEQGCWYDLAAPPICTLIGETE